VILVQIDLQASVQCVELSRSSVCECSVVPSRVYITQVDIWQFWVLSLLFASWLPYRVKNWISPLLSLRCVFQRLILNRPNLSYEALANC